MASLLLKLIKKSTPPPPLLRSLLASRLPDSPVSPRHPIHQTAPIPTPSANPDASHLPCHPLQVYPAFPHCFTSELLCLSGLQHVDVGTGGAAAEEDGGDDGAEVWADSVKKKRKRKMNKHKYRKLRKHLRRQT